MRKPFIQTMTAFAERDPRVILIIGDIGFSYMEEYKQRFPNQFLNIGVLEQAMMDVAVGLVHVGWKPYIYTMSNFVLLRPYEQVRNNICYANANVKLFAVQGGDAYRFMGMSHNLYGTEEKDLLKNLPNITTYFPETEAAVIKAMESEYRRVGPAYIKI